MAEDEFLQIYFVAYPLLRNVSEHKTAMNFEKHNTICVGLKSRKALLEFMSIAIQNQLSVHTEFNYRNCIGTHNQRNTQQRKGTACTCIPTELKASIFNACLYHWKIFPGGCVYIIQ